MKRSDIVALSRAAIKKLATNKVGVVKATQSQLKKLAQHKKKKHEEEAPALVRRAS